MSRYICAQVSRLALRRARETVTRDCFILRYIPATLSLVSDDGYTWLDLPDSTFLPAGPWRGVTGGDLPVPVSVRIHRHADGRVATGPSRRPDDQKLRDFARTYQIELARQPRRAMTAAASAHSISRATANRWAAICREMGFLPDVSKE